MTILPSWLKDALYCCSRSLVPMVWRILGVYLYLQLFHVLMELDTMNRNTHPSFPIPFFRFHLDMYWSVTSAYIYIHVPVCSAFFRFFLPLSLYLLASICSPLGNNIYLNSITFYRLHVRQSRYLSHVRIGVQLFMFRYRFVSSVHINNSLHPSLCSLPNTHTHITERQKLQNKSHTRVSSSRANPRSGLWPYHTKA